jgi:hypothetical protein
MSIFDYFIASFGSASILGLLIFMFKATIKKEIEKSIDYTYDTKIESYKANLKHESDLKLKNLENQLAFNLENAKLYLSQYSQKQFELYNDLWISLVDLKYSIDKLWSERANINNLKDLVKKHSEANRKRLEKAILLEPIHYEELKLLLDEIERFQFGKKTLIDLRKMKERYEDITEYDIDQVIQQNGQTKIRFDQYLDQFRLCIQNQIKGKNKK